MTELEFEFARQRMVEEQLLPRQIVDARVLAAMSRVPRHRFVPGELANHAYEDRPLPIGFEQTISQPYMVALMTQMLRLTGVERVLDVGTGSGYQAAVLAQIAAEVITIERWPELAAEARTHLEQCGNTNVKTLIGDGTQGYVLAAPYDRILVAAAAAQAPQPLIDQLAHNGRLVMPLGSPELQTLTVITKDEQGHTYAHEHGGCMFVPLVSN